MGAKGDLIFVILIIVALGFVWVFTGGPERARNQGVFIKPPAPLDSGGTYGEINVGGGTQVKVGTGSEGTADTGQDETTIEISEFENKISIKSSSTGPKKSVVLEEYITLTASSRNKEKVSITGWKLESMISKNQVTIGGATEVYRSGLVNSEPALKLSPGETVVISTGFSPLGASFKINKCSGYQEQFQDFFPKLSKKCPHSDDEFDDIVSSIPITDNVCEDFVDKISRCEMVVDAFPLGTSSQCSEFVSDTLNYTGCVKKHRNDLDFFTKEWRVFLGRNTELWRKSREEIRLIDSSGKVVDTYTY
ncbi:hypothetical protein HON59_01550 [bacterium]|jgi:hypothetical protein|nr:hypothetical protein [bacterium]MBT3729764.1 hypothetical protein [bacterium]MBT4207052.1 hypothetical protein [Candidatus Woesearchaeota archaeon]MBT4894729.1 hypothetical protein [bacterium]